MRSIISKDESKYNSHESGMLKDQGLMPPKAQSSYSSQHDRHLSVTNQINGKLQGRNNTESLK